VDAVVALAAVLLMTGSVAEAPVADAAMREDVDAVRALLQGGADVNAAQGDGMTALHWAAEHGHVDLTDMLIYAGANLGPTTRVGAYTPLMVGARAGQGAIVGHLLEAGADVDSRTATGVTALHLAAGSGSAEAVSALLDHGAEVDAKEVRWAQTPLMWAADRGRTEAAKLLILAGAEIDAMSKIVMIETLTAEDAIEGRAYNERMTAIRAERLAEATEGQESWADPAAAAEEEAAAADDEEKPAEEEKAVVVPDQDALAPPPAIEEEKKEDEEEEPEPTPLGYDDLVGGHGGLTALHHAVRQGNTETALALIDAGADIDLVTGGDQTSPLLMATINGHFDLGAELVALGADVNLPSHAGAAPLFATINVYWAPKALYPQPRAYEQQTLSYLEFMQVLLDAGADPNARVSKHIWYMSYNFDLLGINMDGATPFWRAAYATDVQAMKLLVANGADHTIPTRKPAQRTRRRGDDAPAEDPSGLEPVPVGGPGAYPIHAASGVGYGQNFAANSHRYVPDGWVPAVKYLVEELGVEVDQRDYDGYSAVHHAAARGDNALINYLVEKGADVTLVSRRGQTTADMANGPQSRVQPFPETLELLVSLGAVNNNKCRSC
jgi:ankyrin repeat protein